MPQHSIEEARRRPLAWAPMALRLVLVALLASWAGTGSALAAPAPKPGQTALISTVSGKVLVKERGESRFQRLPGSPTLVRMGAVIDATAGKVRVRAAGAKGRPLSDGVFSRGRFAIDQQRRDGAVTELDLTGGDPNACVPGADFPAGVQRRLAAAVNGRFRMRGSFGTVEAQKPDTGWVMEDRCDGTRTSVKSGAVEADGSGQLILTVLADQIVHHFCDYDGVDAVSQAFCTAVLYAPHLGIWGGGIANQGDATSYELCVTNPAGEQRCETYPFSAPYGQNLHDSVVSCPGDGPGAHSLRWFIDGIQLGPPLEFTSNAPAGQGCQHKP